MRAWDCEVPATRSLILGASETDCVFKLRERVRDLAQEMIDLTKKNAANIRKRIRRVSKIIIILHKGVGAMIVQELVDLLQAEVVAGIGKCDNEISGGYASDLLSYVMGQGKNGNVWVTMQGHQNIVAIASLLGLSAIVIAGDVKPETETISKADSEEIPLLITTLSVFAASGLLYEKGVSGA